MTFTNRLVAYLKRRITNSLAVRHWLWKIRQRISHPSKKAFVTHSLENHESAPSSMNEKLRILFIEDRVPHSYLGTGYPRSNLMLHEMVRRGYAVTLYPMMFPYELPNDAYRDIPREVNVALGYGAFGLQQFLTDYKKSYDLILISRPHNMEILRRFLGKAQFGLSGVPIVYDSESLFCLREIVQSQLQGKIISPEIIKQRIDREIDLARGCSSVICVSRRESRLFLDHGIPKVHVLSYALEPHPTPNTFINRNDILFVGALPDGSPNLDSILWFTENIFPVIQAKIGNVRLILAGSNCSDQVHALANNSIEVLGQVQDLTTLYNRARLFVVPTRFGAGIPLKIIEAASRGLPVVTTDLMAEQLEWKKGTEILAASNEEEFAQHCINLYQNPELWSALRSNALQRITSEYSPSLFSKNLCEILEGSV